MPADQTSRRAYSIPAICTFRDFAYEGGLMAYFAEEDEMYRSAAVLVDKILNGAKPAEFSSRAAYEICAAD